MILPCPAQIEYARADRKSCTDSGTPYSAAPGLITDPTGRNTLFSVHCHFANNTANDLQPNPTPLHHNHPLPLPPLHPHHPVRISQPTHLPPTHLTTSLAAASSDISAGNTIGTRSMVSRVGRSNPRQIRLRLCVGVCYAY